MAMRKPRTNNRHTAKNSQQQGVSERDEDGGERGGKPRKRKLSDMLGPPWSKEDLELFYQAYRKFGKDWKKVAGGVQKRTTEMVEALFGINRAYLSLPEGAATAEGLIAMMTDHYSNVESEDDSSDELGTSDRSHQLQPRSRTRGAQVNNNTNSGPSGYGGPSSAKKPRSVAASRPWMVGKRTPRYPAANAVKQKGKSKVVITKVVQEETSDEENDQTKEAEVVARVLVTASQQQAPSSPLISRSTPTKKYSRAPLQNGHAKESSLRTESDGSGPKHTASTSGEFGPEGSQESKEKPGRALTKVVLDELELADRAKVQGVDGKGKWKKPAAKKTKLQMQDVKFDEANERCSQTGTQEGEVRDNDYEKPSSMQKKKQFSTQRTKKRSRQLFSGDQSGLDALAELADMSLNGLLPSPTPHTESEKEEDKPQTSDADVLPHRSGGEKNGKDVEKTEGSTKGGHEEETSKDQAHKEDVQVASGSRQQSTSPPDSRKRKRKGAPEKNASQGKSGADEQGQSIAEPQVELPKVETPVVLKPRRKPKRLTTAKTVSKQGLKVNKAGDASGLEVELSVQGPGHRGLGDEGSLPLKLRSKKKGVADKGPVNGFGNVSSSSVPVELVRDAPNCPHTTAELGPFNTKARLIHCLSPKVRRWCMYEWFYSAIDLPWFAHNEFVEYLNHAGLGHVPRLTRVEWGVIRSSLGKPRRLSKSFLQEEREKLESYREGVRTHYHELRAGHREGLPLDLARPLTVGQRVIAKHPKTGQIHDGSILTVDRSRCRVQFDRPELGVEFVADIDAMPIHPLENMSENMRRKRTVLDAADQPLEDSKMDVKSRVSVSAGGAARAALNERLDRPGSIPGLPVISPMFLTNLIKTAQANTVDAVRFAKAATAEAVAATQHSLLTQPYTPGLSQARESDIRTLVQLGGALNKKEPLVVELRRMNDEGAAYKGSDAFQQQYSAIVLQVKGVNEEVLDALKHLRNRSRNQDISTPPWQRGVPYVRTANGGPSPGEGNLPGPVEADITISDIAASSKKHARAMVSVAVQSISNLEEGEDPLSKIGGALDMMAKGNPCVEGKPTAAASSSTLTPTITQGLSGTSALTAGPLPLAAVDANGDVDKSIEVHASQGAAEVSAPKTEEVPLPDPVEKVPRGDGKEAIFLTELTASCVATLLMVQTFTERQFSGPDVALSLDTALKSLRPQAAQNHYIFKDIEQQLEYIKTQILSQIPVQTNLPFPVDSPIIAQPNPT